MGLILSCSIRVARGFLGLAILLFAIQACGSANDDVAVGAWAEGPMCERGFLNVEFVQQWRDVGWWRERRTVLLASDGERDVASSEDLLTVFCGVKSSVEAVDYAAMYLRSMDAYGRGLGELSVLDYESLWQDDEMVGLPSANVRPSGEFRVVAVVFFRKGQAPVVRKLSLEFDSNGHLERIGELDLPSGIRESLCESASDILQERVSWSSGQR